MRCLCTGQTEGDIGYDERDFYDTEYDSASGQFGASHTIVLYCMQQIFRCCTIGYRFVNRIISNDFRWSGV